MFAAAVCGIREPHCRRAAFLNILHDCRVGAAISGRITVILGSGGPKKIRGPDEHSVFLPRLGAQ